MKDSGVQCGLKLRLSPDVTLALRKKKKYVMLGKVGLWSLGFLPISSVDWPLEVTERAYRTLLPEKRKRIKL